MQPLKKVQPLLSRVLVQKVVPPKKTSNGILLPDSKVASNIGQVVEVGPGSNVDGVFVKTTLKVGQFVLLPEYGAVKVPKVDGKDDLLIYSESDILAVVEGEFNTKI